MALALNSHLSPIPGMATRPSVAGIVLATALVPAILSAGCTSVAQVTTLSDSPCNEAFRNGITAILIEQKEDPEIASRLAHDAAKAHEAGKPGPRPFLLSSSSGADYSFFVQSRSGGCLLRLYGRQKGFASYTNNLTYIATQPLAPCQCSE